MTIADANPYAVPWSGGDVTAAMAAESERVTFIQRTYLHLAGAIVAFVGLEAAIFSLVPAEVLEKLVFSVLGSWTWLIFLGGFVAVSWIADSWARSATSRPKQYWGLGLYVVAEAVLFAPLLYVASRFADPSLIPAAGTITLVIFGGLTFIVFLTRADFSFLRMYLMWGGLLALGLVICGVLFSWNLGMWFSVAMIALASGYILYDTSNVLHHYRTDQYVAASLALFASVALMLWYVIQLLMSLSSSD